MIDFTLPEEVMNIINDSEIASVSGKRFPNLNPHTGDVICQVTRSCKDDVLQAIEIARNVQPDWGETPPVIRGEMLYRITDLMQTYKEDIAEIVSIETGKSIKASLGETGGAIACGRFMAGEGQRFFGRTMTSGVENKYAMTIREPLGVAGLIIAANTPIANVAWKVFPALICGNSAILKASEDAPLTAWIFGKIAAEAELPRGVFSVIQGFGQEAGAPLVESTAVDIISFTGSTEIGRYIACKAGERLAKVSLELGGKNPLVICDDADIDNAVRWTVLSGFSNAGQRCASASRIIIFDNIYDQFRDRLVEATKKIKLGVHDDDDLGPVINEAQLKEMLSAIGKAKQAGASILVGGNRIVDSKLVKGFYMAPTILENVDRNSEIAHTELFGPIIILFRATGYDEALSIANDSSYGLTSCIHTKNIDRATHFARHMKSGVAVINGGTYGSEPHMPFGGVKSSGNGSREPGTEALDVYSNLKDIYQFVDVKNL